MPFLKLTKPYAIWICASFFYIYQMFLRVSPSLIVNDLMIFFQINGTQVATLTAWAMYAYSLMQIPVGVLIDVYGVRKILFCGLAMLCLCMF